MKTASDSGSQKLKKKLRTIPSSVKMAIYCWGSTSNGELGIGGVEDEQILIPREMAWSQSPTIDMICCGPLHTLFLSNSGRVYSCGNNDYGQLGHELPRKRPQVVSNLENHVIKQVACGKSHSLAINEWGQLFTWGSNSSGQLGHDSNDISSAPKLVRYLATKQIVQIASGHYHSLALTNDGELYSWGLNNYGQLGLGQISSKINKPTRISSVAGIPIAFVACGGYHSFCITKSGAVYGWGKNTFGQLGVSDEQSRFYPAHLKTLRSIGVRHISAGEDFSVFLTVDGGVFTCGCGTYGQLGHGNANNEVLPRKIIELMGTVCSQISCGNRHTLTFVPSRGRVYGFGLGGSGQLGNRTAKNSQVPQVVVGPWASPNGITLLNESVDVNEYPLSVRRIFSGGDHSFASAGRHGETFRSFDSRNYEAKSQIAVFSVELAEACAVLGKNETVNMELMTAVETVFKSLACMNGSFLSKNDHELCCSKRNSGVDIAGAEKAFDFIRKMENDSLKTIIWDGITSHLLKALSPSPADVEVLRIYLILPIYHEFINSKNYSKLHSPFSQAVISLNKIPSTILSEWWTHQPIEYFERLVENYRHVIAHIINYNFPKLSDSSLPLVRHERNLELALKMMELLFQINLSQRIQRVPYDIFYLHDLLESVDLQQDYLLWITRRPNANDFHLCNYPFLFDAKAKSLLLQTDQAIQMQAAMQQAQQNHILNLFSFGRQSDDASQFVVFNVTRENLVEDTIREICMYQPKDLQKPLKVKFHGEEAEDAGGVRKEFFMLLIKEILDPKYGMFKEFEDSRVVWFSEHSFEEEEMFKLIGTLIGLAIYNFTIINLPFPLVMYKKLLNEKIELIDLEELSETLAHSMKSILAYEGDDFKEVFDLTFEVSREVFGELQTIPLKPGGSNIAVTQENKAEFVDLYIDFILNKSVEKQFNGFHTGFMRVCGGRVMKLFRSHELMALVVGNEDYDWDALEQYAQYKGGYASSDQTIQWFWEVFHDMSLEEKKKFLLFLTGSDRIPIDGMKAIRIFIQPTNDDKFLPVAHTCFNLLDLPRYQTKEKLKYKLLQAIQQTQGFSLV